MPRSAIPAVKAALVGVIQGALPNVQVTWAAPRGASSAREWVLVGNVTGDQQAAAIGRLRRKERFRIEVLVSIVKSEIEHPQDLAERAYELAGEIEDALRADELLGLTTSGPLLWARVEKTDLSESADKGERWAEVTVHVVCETRI